MTQSIPRAEALLDRVRLQGKDGYWQWIVLRCPYCRKQHRHGAGVMLRDNPRRFLDVRVAHCRLCPDVVYQLVEMQE
jgi:hypothetical protein